MALRLLPRLSSPALLIIDKPLGVTCREASAVATEHLWPAGAKGHVGHVGTLDPLASGVLPVLIGRATRLSSLLPRTPKVYEAEVKLGAETTTDDGGGDITVERDWEATGLEARLQSVLRGFEGRIEQVPPVYSAIRVGGVRAYKLARSGRADIVMPTRTVEVHSIEGNLTCDGSMIWLRVCCGEGTYIRSIARDVARALGTAGHLASLRRTQSGPFRLQSNPTEATEELDWRATLTRLAPETIELPSSRQVIECVQRGQDPWGLLPSQPSGDRYALGIGGGAAAILERSCKGAPWKYELNLLKVGPAEKRRRMRERRRQHRREKHSHV